MTQDEQRALDERIRDMKRRGIPTSERIAILKREQAEAGPDPEQGKPPAPAPPVVRNDDSVAEHTAESDACNATAGEEGPFSGSLAPQSPPCTDPAAPVAGDDPGAPAVAVQSNPGHDGAEVLAAAVPGVGQGDAGPGRATPATPKVAKPTTSSSKKRTVAKRRKPRTRTVRKDVESMTAVHANEVSGAAQEAKSSSRLKIGEVEPASDKKPDGRDRDRPLVAPIMVDAHGAAARFSTSVRTWRRRDRDGSVPRGVMLKGRKLWRVQDLELWSEWGLPNRSTFDKRLRDQRNAARR